MLLTLRTIKRKKIKSTTKNSTNHQQPPPKKLTNLKIKPNPKVSKTPDNAKKKHVASTIPAPPPTPADPANTVISVQSEAPQPGHPVPNKGTLPDDPNSTDVNPDPENLTTIQFSTDFSSNNTSKNLQPLLSTCITPPPERDCKK